MSWFASSRTKARGRFLEPTGTMHRSPRRFCARPRLDVEFPGLPPAPHLLACVVKSTRQPEAKWTAECWLPLPLRRAELSWLGIKRGIALKADRRKSLRWACRGEAFFRSVGVNESDYYPATVSDISFEGVRLTVSGQAPEVGTSLEIVLERMPPAPPIRMLGIVCHRKELPESGNVFGCSFLRELGWNELWSVLSPSSQKTETIQGSVQGQVGAGQDFPGDRQ
jgi:hypothetical protein